MPALTELHDTELINDFLHKVSGHLAYDVGANGGNVTRILATHFDEVVACEPANSFDTLVNDIPDNVRAVHAAVTEEVGEVTLSNAQKTEGIGELVTPTEGPIQSSWGSYTSSEQCRAITLDYMALNYGTPDFIKIDVEGHETYVIRGGHSLFSTHSPRLLIEVHDHRYGTEIRALLPGYEWERFDHSAYQHPGQAQMRENHYWLVGHRSDIAE